MGASFDSREYDYSLGKEKIEKLWETEVESSLHESGHSYSGGIGMLGSTIAPWQDKDDSYIKLTRQEAFDFISDNHQKWDCAMAVSFFHEGKKKWLIGGWCSS
jgi:phage gp16-like protein